MKLSRKVLLSTIAAGTIAATLFSTPALALLGYLTETTYYSDATKTTEVGYSITTCSGKKYTQGTVTTYKDVSREPC